ncbi:signal peptidase II [Actinophytocola sp.]|uniref:signal peptidase II n=1 Tax=Actinophytocola sp. TaxID=1872138 RepID=UPI002EDB23F7
MVLALLVGLIAVDQAAKWWAWRHAAGVHINYGGNALVGTTVSRWYANPVTGGVLDVLDFALLSTAVALLLRRRRPTVVLVTGTLMIGGWISNLVDRLGLHYWTAPGSVRGAVDFIHMGQIYYNLADVFIVVGTLSFLLAVGASATGWSTGSWTPTRRRLRARGWMSTIAAAAGLIVVVTFGAVNYGGVTAPDTTAIEAGQLPG